jgi:hypothetical protein
MPWTSRDLGLGNQEVAWVMRAYSNKYGCGWAARAATAKT